MLEMEVGVDGRADLQRQLDALKKKASPERLNKALLAGGEVFKDAIVERTPERTDEHSGDALKPGELKGDIHVVLHDAGKHSRVTVGPGPKTAYVMRWLEWGHRLVAWGYSKLGQRGARGPGTEIGEVPAYPVMRPAYEASRDDSMRAVIASLKESEK